MVNTIHAHLKRRIKTPEGINILEHKSVQFRVWLDNIAQKRSLDSTLTVKQIYEMLDFLDGMEEKVDGIILKAFDLV